MAYCHNVSIFTLTTIPMPRLALPQDDEELDILLELLEDQLNLAEVCCA